MRLQAWLGHKRIDETMIYVHVAEAHHCELPEIVREAARGIDDPDARDDGRSWQPRGSRSHRREGFFNDVCCLIRASEGTRTPTALRPMRPKRIAATNYATLAEALL